MNTPTNEKLTQASVKLALKARGVSFKRLAATGEFLVGGSYYTNSLRDALLTGMRQSKN